MDIGGIQQLNGQNFATFDPPPTMCRQFLYPEHGQKQTFFDPFPPHLVHIVIECPLTNLFVNQPNTDTYQFSS